VVLKFPVHGESNGKGVGETGVSPCRKVLKTERLSENFADAKFCSIPRGGTHIKNAAFEKFLETRRIKLLGLN